MFFLLVFIFFLLVTDAYSFWGLKSSLFKDNTFPFILIYLGTTAITIIGFVWMVKTASNGYSSTTLGVNIFFGMAFSFIVAKLLMSSLFFAEDILRGFIWLFQKVIQFRASDSIPRSFIWGVFSLLIGSLMALLLNYGVLFGKYQYKVHTTVLEFENLPEAFEGFKIGQMSDMHLGTFDNIKKVKKGIQIFQDQNTDIMLFTGDMVNSLAEEAVPYIDLFKDLNAPFGKFTVMGNHDYGDHGSPTAKTAYIKNIQQLEGIEKQMGMRWLKNENVPLVKDGDTIYLAGVDNWGLPPFPQHGDLKAATQHIKPTDFTILLSHDPSHWRHEVLQSESNVDLTLSGHTHGMQFGIEIGRLKWSPVKYRYPDWAGLYESMGKYLYVNRGFGNIGYPGRIGIWPELTVIELRRKK